VVDAGFAPCLFRIQWYSGSRIVEESTNQSNQQICLHALLAGRIGIAYDVNVLELPASLNRFAGSIDVLLTLCRSSAIGLLPKHRGATDFPRHPRTCSFLLC
jgi:hypothetical protein